MSCTEAMGASHFILNAQVTFHHANSLLAIFLVVCTFSNEINKTLFDKIKNTIFRWFVVICFNFYETLLFRLSCGARHILFIIIRERARALQMPFSMFAIFVYFISCS